MAQLVYVHEVEQLAVHKRRYLNDGNIRLPRLENENMDRDLDMSFFIVQFKNSTLMDLFLCMLQVVYKITSIKFK